MMKRRLSLLSTLLGSAVCLTSENGLMAQEGQPVQLRPRTDIPVKARQADESLSTKTNLVAPALASDPPSMNATVQASAWTENSDEGPQLVPSPRDQEALSNVRTPPIRKIESLGPPRIQYVPRDPKEFSSSEARQVTSSRLGLNAWRPSQMRVGIDDPEARKRPSLSKSPTSMSNGGLSAGSQKSLGAMVDRDESMTRPTLPLRSSALPERGPALQDHGPTATSGEMDHAVRPAQYRLQDSGLGGQGFAAPPGTGQPGFNAPVPGAIQPGLNGQPNYGAPSASLNDRVLPSNPSGMPGNPALVPNRNSISGQPQLMNTPLGSSTIPSPADPANLPRYEPRVVTGEPFVTGEPCQFDAYDMVHPANYQYPVCGGPSIMPGAMTPAAAGAPYSYVPPTITPDMAPGLYAPNNGGWRPLFTLGQENYNAQLGRGLWGQPTAYVQGQPFRNALRYFSF